MNLIQLLTHWALGLTNYGKDVRYALTLRRIQRANEEHLRDICLLISIRAWENTEWKEQVFTMMKTLEQDAMDYLDLTPPARLTSLPEMQAIHEKEREFMRLQQVAAGAVKQAYEKQKDGDKVLIQQGFTYLNEAVSRLDELENMRTAMKQRLKR